MDDAATDRTADTGQRSIAPDRLTAREAAARLTVHERTIRRAIARGELPAAKRSGTFLIAPSDLDGFRERRRGAREARARAPDRRAHSAEIVTDLQPSPFPRPLSSLIGREEALAASAAALRDPESGS